MRGNIRKRGAGSWQLKIELERVAGNRKTRFITVRGTYKDAQRELSKLLGAADAGTLPDPTNTQISSYLRNYLDNATHLSPKTLERYRELANRQIVPHLGDVKLQKLRPEHLEAWHAAAKEWLSARTVGHAHRVLGSALDRAVKNGTLARNVAAISEPPKVEDEEIEILTADQAKAVLEALRGHAL